jgi:hypothetical protein
MTCLTSLYRLLFGTHRLTVVLTSARGTLSTKPWGDDGGDDDFTFMEKVRLLVEGKRSRGKTLTLFVEPPQCGGTLRTQKGVYQVRGSRNGWRAVPAAEVRKLFAKAAHFGDFDFRDLPADPV